jgi:Zn finger protein HypA/HybF involved in hydrogenase expression
MMSAVRCKECQFVSKENNGFCPECGAMYVEPLDYVDASLAGKAPAQVKVEKKKGGLLASLFGGAKNDSKSAESVSARSEVKPRQTVLPDAPRDQIRIRCQECEEMTGIDAHEGYCPNCGAFFVEPFDYVTQESLAAEREALQADISQYKPVHKSFEEMTDAEKLAHLKEKLADTWDQIVKDRYVLNEKANECMQCFTAAGTIKSEDQYEVLASTIKQRYHNLQDFEILNREYRQLLDQFNQLHEGLLQVHQEYAALSAQTQQVPG